MILIKIKGQNILSLSTNMGTIINEVSEIIDPDKFFIKGLKPDIAFGKTYNNLSKAISDKACVLIHSSESKKYRWTVLDCTHIIPRILKTYTDEDLCKGENI